jgi:hypothetical protein
MFFSSLLKLLYTGDALNRALFMRGMADRFVGLWGTCLINRMVGRDQERIKILMPGFVTSSFRWRRHRNKWKAKSCARQRNRRRHIQPICGLGGILFWIGAFPLSPEAQAIAPCTHCGLLPPLALVWRRNEVLMYRIAAVVDYSAAVAANMASAAPPACIELPETAPVRVLSFVCWLMEPLPSEKKIFFTPSWCSGRRFRLILCGSVFKTGAFFRLGYWLILTKILPRYVLLSPGSMWR